MTESTGRHAKRLVPPPRRFLGWTLADWHTFLVILSSYSGVAVGGFVIGVIWR